MQLLLSTIKIQFTSVEPINMKMSQRVNTACWLEFYCSAVSSSALFYCSKLSFSAIKGTQASFNVFSLTCITFSLVCFMHAFSQATKGHGHLLIWRRWISNKSSCSFFLKITMQRLFGTEHVWLTSKFRSQKLNFGARTARGKKT